MKQRLSGRENGRGKEVRRSLIRHEPRPSLVCHTCAWEMAFHRTLEVGGLSRGRYEIQCGHGVTSKVIFLGELIPCKF
jgi:hypothetical protein